MTSREMALIVADVLFWDGEAAAQRRAEEFRAEYGSWISSGSLMTHARALQAAVARENAEPREDHHAPLEPDDGRDSRGLGGPCLGHACNCTHPGEPCGERQ